MMREAYEAIVKVQLLGAADQWILVMEVKDIVFRCGPICTDSTQFVVIRIDFSLFFVESCHLSARLSIIL